MFLRLSVSHSVHGGDVHPLGRHPPRRTPHPLGRHPPRQIPPPRWQLKWAVRILLECVLVYFNSYVKAVFKKCKNQKFYVYPQSVKQ